MEANNSQRSLRDTDVMTFGAHKGKMLGQVPADYFLWLRDQNWIKPDLREYIDSNMEAFKLEAKNKKPWL